MILSTPETTHAAGHSLAPHLRAGDIVALSGNLGVGKSTFTRGLLAGLGFEGDVPSPSFALVIPYAPPDVRLPLWHVDLYRLERQEDVEELGLDDALDEGALVIEWAERLGSRLWPDALKIEITRLNEGGRCLTAQAPPSWEGRCPLI
jgi:tRNA threonylcarbamoyladenosine biosynthesis protein TsaE